MKLVTIDLCLHISKTGKMADSSVSSTSDTVQTNIAISKRAILTPAIAVLSLSLLLVCGSFVIAVVGMNRTARETSQNLAQATIERAGIRIAELAIDYAFWDESINRLVITKDTVWANDNIGVYMHDTFGISYSAVLDGTGRTIMAFHNGEESSVEASTMLGANLVQYILAEKRPGAGTAPPLRAGLAKTMDGVSIIGFAPFTPETTTSKIIATGDGAVLVFAQKLTDPVLDKLGASVTLAKFRISETADTAKAQIALTGLLGTDVGYASWRQEYPGNKLLTPLIPAVIGAIIALTVLMRMLLGTANRIIIERRELARELSQERALSDIRSRFVSMISHEIRTPLANIQSAADLIARYWERMPDAERRGEINAIQTSLSSIKTIIEDIVSLDRIDASIPRRELVDVAEICREQWSELTTALRASHQLKLETNSSPALLNTDVTLLRAAIRNVVSNAIKYSPHGSAVRIVIKDNKEHLVLRVEDQGCGIPNDDAERIFEPFFRTAAVSHIQGIGIGLTIARSALNQMGGTLALVAGAPDGAQFEIKIPKALDKF